MRLINTSDLSGEYKIIVEYKIEYKIDWHWRNVNVFLFISIYAFVDFTLQSRGIEIYCKLFKSGTTEGKGEKWELVSLGHWFSSRTIGN